MPLKVEAPEKGDYLCF